MMFFSSAVERGGVFLEKHLDKKDVFRSLVKRRDVLFGEKYVFQICGQEVRPAF